jgi:hypothetical protein
MFLAFIVENNASHSSKEIFKNTMNMSHFIENLHHQTEGSVARNQVMVFLNTSTPVTFWV